MSEHTDGSRSEPPQDRPAPRHARKGNGRDLGPLPQTETPVPDLEAAFADMPNLHAATTPFTDIEAAVSMGGDGISVVEIAANYDCRKPNKSEFFRSFQDVSLWRETYVLVDQDTMDRTTYLVMPVVRPLLWDHLSPAVLVPCINTSGTVFTWRITTSDVSLGKRASKWGTSALAAAEAARAHWVKLVPAENRYRTFKAEGNLGDPDWPEDLTRQSMIVRTFPDEQIIGSEDHPIIKAYRGRQRR